MSSSNPDIPERMYRAGRPLDPDFLENELLYRRCQLEHVQENRLLPSGINFPDWSVNRSKYSELDDVLIPNYGDWGIVQFEVQNVPKSLTSSGDTRFDFKVEHVPLEENYSHSEVRTYKNGEHSKKIEVSKTIKKQFRQILAEKTVLMRQPRI